MKQGDKVILIREVGVYVGGSTVEYLAGTTLTVTKVDRYNLYNEANHAFSRQNCVPWFDTTKILGGGIGFNDLVKLKADSKVMTLNKERYYKVSYLSGKLLKLEGIGRSYGIHNFDLYNRAFCTVEDIC